MESKRDYMGIRHRDFQVTLVLVATALSESLLRGRQHGVVESAWVLRPG